MIFSNNVYCQIHCQIGGSRGIAGDFGSKQISKLLFCSLFSAFSHLSLTTIAHTTSSPTSDGQSCDSVQRTTHTAGLWL